MNDKNCKVCGVEFLYHNTNELISCARKRTAGDTTFERFLDNVAELIDEGAKK